MKLSGHEINSQLRQKLELPTGRHLYLILGTYGRLERYERADFPEARCPTGRRLADPVNVNHQLLQRVPDEELKRMVQTEASRTESVKDRLSKELDALVAEKLETAALKAEVNGYKDRLFESALDRNGVDAGLKHRPQPEGCTLHIDQADSLVAAAEQALEQARAELHAALLNIASLLLQPALQALLEQGKDEPFIADVLAASSDETLSETLAQCIPADPAHAKLLAKYLKKIVVKVVHLQDFQPSKTKVEKADIETVVGEFRRFLETALDDRDGKQSIIGEIR